MLKNKKDESTHFIKENNEIEIENQKHKFENEEKEAENQSNERPDLNLVTLCLV